MNKNASDPVLILLAGGAGTRLRPVVSNVPKALAPISDKPFLDFILTQYAKEGVRRIVLSLHHKADAVIDYVKGHPIAKEISLEYVLEPSPYGTGGAVKFAIANAVPTEKAVFVANADTWVPGAFESLKNHIETPQIKPISAMALVRVPDVSRYGSVLVGSDHLVERFLEKNGGKGEGEIYAGISYLQTAPIKAMKETTFSLESDFFPRLVSEKTLSAICVESPFIDIGTPEDYAKFCQSYGR